MFTLDQVVPWGRSFDEYRQMFALTDQDLALRIVGCGDGPASFNAEATRRGTAVVSCDPIYRYDVEDIRARIASTCDRIIEQTHQNADEFVWTVIPSIEALKTLRMAAMDDFLNDYPTGASQSRYLDAELPSLPFQDSSFDLALCSHLLFLYTAQLGEAFHRLAIREMCRVAREVRIFPLLALGATPSPLVDPMIAECARWGFAASIERVPYEFQRGGNEMMRLRRTP
jgi:Methyltransferase domain